MNTTHSTQQPSARKPKAAASPGQPSSALINRNRRQLLRLGIGLLSLGLLLILTGAVAVMAQEKPLVVTLTGVESQNFPQVTAWLTVADAVGPVEGLSTDNFEIIEDNQPAAVIPVTVKAEALQNLRLVIAVDTSTTDANLAEAKAAVINMVDNLGPGDKAALLSFGNAVTQEYGFTNNTTALQDAVGRLSPKKEKSALNQASVTAATMLDEFADGRKAIIVITTNFDNTGSPTANQLSAQLEQSGAPLYVVGLGNKTQSANPLKNQAAASGGQFTYLPKIDGLSDAVLELEKTLRKGYQVSFQSGLKADNRPHALSINVTGTAGNGDVAGSFVAIPNEIVITPHGIAANQSVKGVVNLAAEVVSPAQLVAVSYLLDKQLLAEVSSLPYNFAWDTTAATPGDHLLTIKAVDRAGNEAQVGLNLVVLAPLRVSLSTTAKQFEIGQQAAIQVKIESLAEISRLDLLLDGQVIDSKTAPPYHFGLDSAPYPAGDHQLAVRAEDSLGRVAESSLGLTFVPAPPPPPGRVESFFRSQRVQSGLLIVAASVAVLAVAVVAVLTIIFLNRIYRQRSRRQTQLEIINLGNIQSRYSLSGRDTQDNLQFRFTLHGAGLPEMSPQIAGDSGAGPLPQPAAVRTAAQPKSLAGRVQTPVVEPNDSLWVDMQIIPRSPYKKATCAFEIVSQAIDQPYAPKIKERGTVEVGGVFWGWRYLSFLVVLVTAGWLIWQIVWLALGRLPAVGISQLFSMIG